jgi:hypothetical protein
MVLRLRIPQHVISAIARFLSPGYGVCGVCRMPWRFTEPHTTDYHRALRGMFPLCERDWARLTPAERLPHYANLFATWREREPEEWNEIEAAVLSGK